MATASFYTKEGGQRAAGGAPRVRRLGPRRRAPRLLARRRTMAAHRPTSLTDQHPRQPPNRSTCPHRRLLPRRRTHTPARPHPSHNAPGRPIPSPAPHRLLSLIAGPHPAQRQGRSGLFRRPPPSAPMTTPTPPLPPLFSAAPSSPQRHTTPAHFVSPRG